MRRLLLPAILIAAAFLAFRISDDRGAQTPTAVASADIVSPGTPMLSARRIPDVLAEPRAFELVELDLQLVASQMPSLSCLVAHDADGRELFSTKGQVGLAPASLQKLVTANAVLQHLGPDFTFRTAVMATSAPVDGVLEGDLFLIGGGDPLFHSEAYVASYPHAFPYTSADALADTLVGLGITTITGGVVANETRYDNLRQPTAWDGTSLARDGNTGPLGAMMLNDGFVAFPAVREAGIFSTPAADPALHAAQAFDDLLEARAVTIRGGSRNVAELPAGLIEIANIESLPLIEIVDEMLTFSDNATAELLLKELGLAFSGDGSTDSGALAAFEILGTDAIDLTSVRVVDGSGLSDVNRLSCDAVIALLETHGADSALADALAVSGRPGTLAFRFSGPLLSGRVHAKSGSLTTATGLAGFVDTARNETVTFAYLVNEEPAVSQIMLDLQTTLLQFLINFPDGPPTEELVPLPLGDEPNAIYDAATAPPSPTVTPVPIPAEATEPDA